MVGNKKHFFDEDYYQQCMQKYKDQKEEMQHRKEQMEKMEIDRYTFKPQISKNSQILAKKTINQFHDKMSVEQRLLLKGKAYESKLKREKLKAEKSMTSQDKFMNKTSEEILLKSNQAKLTDT